MGPVLAQGPDSRVRRPLLDHQRVHARQPGAMALPRLLCRREPGRAMAGHAHPDRHVGLRGDFPGPSPERSRVTLLTSLADDSQGVKQKNDAATPVTIVHSRATGINRLYFESLPTSVARLGLGRGLVHSPRRLGRALRGLADCPRERVRSDRVVKGRENLHLVVVCDRRGAVPRVGRVDERRAADRQSLIRPGRGTYSCEK